VPPAITLGQTFQGFYDPNGHFNGPLRGSFSYFERYGRRRLMTYLDDRRATPVNLPAPEGTVPVIGRQLLAVELAHLMLITHDDYTQAEHLDLGQDDLEQAIGIANFGAEQIVRGVHAGVEVMLERDPVLRELSEMRDPKFLLSSGAMLAAIAHDGQERLSGWPFFEHPKAAAGIAGIAARMRLWSEKPRDLTPYEEHTLRRLQYSILAHDILENEIISSGDEKGTSFLIPRGRVVSTPLVHYLELQDRGLSYTECFSGARDNYLYTKPSAPEKEGRMDYGGYMVRMETYPETEAGKGVDVHHNWKTDPIRLQPIDRRHAEALEKELRQKSRERNYRMASHKIRHDVLRSDASPIIKRIVRNTPRVKSSDLDKLWGSMRILSRLENGPLIDAYSEGERRKAA